jgi:hypothetical protein
VTTGQALLLIGASEIIKPIKGGDVVEVLEDEKWLLESDPSLHLRFKKLIGTTVTVNAVVTFRGRKFAHLYNGVIQARLSDYQQVEFAYWPLESVRLRAVR